MLDGNQPDECAASARDWAKEYAELSANDGDLAPEDLERCAVAAHLLGEDEQALRLLDRAHIGYLDRGMPDKAARAVFWLVHYFHVAGQAAQAAGWLARLHRILDDHDPAGRQSYLPLGLEARLAHAGRCNGPGDAAAGAGRRSGPGRRR
jgi:hypothetical protein